MRLIDADAIRNDIVKNEKNALWILDDAPTIDAVEVVRCRECKMAHDPDNSTVRGRVITCGLYASRPIMRVDDFCSYGERRTDE